MNILLLSAYDAPSHRYWMQGLIDNLSDYNFTCLTLPARHFNWRIRGNALSWYNLPEFSQAFDVLLATSMVDVAALRGVHPHLARLPCVVYCHENQFAYPKSLHQKPPLEPLMVNLYNALAADKLVFNSNWNRASFIAGAQQLLAQMPDHVPDSILPSIAAKAEILPVPMRAYKPGVKSPAPFSAQNPLEIVWNHRWEFDKGPDLLLAIVQALPQHLPLRFYILGQQFRQQPAEFAQIKILIEERFELAHWGYCADELAYLALLERCHLVLSTAWHDFQGLAILQAASSGATPLVPNGLAYPEWFAAEFRFGSEMAFAQRDLNALAADAAKKISDYARGIKPLKNVDTAGWGWAELKARYCQLFDSLKRNAQDKG